MPYKDPEVRKKYAQEYEKKKRASWTDEQRKARSEYVQRRRQQRKEGKRDSDIEFFEREGGSYTGIVVERAGLRRKRTEVPVTVHHLLTKRQQDVHNNRAHMSRGWVRMERIMAETGMTMEEFVQGLSVEELVRGKFRDKSGKMQGRPPKFVPREFHRACLQELMRRGRDMWQKNYLAAIEAMTDIATGKGQVGAIATPGERLKAAQFVVERMEGKVPERLVVTDERPWQTVMDGIVAEVPQEAIERGRKALEAAETVMDAEIVDIEYDDIDEDPDPRPVRSRRRRK